MSDVYVQSQNRRFVLFFDLKWGILNGEPFTHRWTRGRLWQEHGCAWKHHPLTNSLFTTVLVTISPLYLFCLQKQTPLFIALNCLSFSLLFKKTSCLFLFYIFYFKILLILHVMGANNGEQDFVSVQYQHLLDMLQHGQKTQVEEKSDWKHNKNNNIFRFCPISWWDFGHISLHDFGTLLFTRRRMGIVLNTTCIHTRKKLKLRR